MLENYTRLENGVVKQLEIEPTVYDSEYVNRTGGVINDTMSYLRLGYLIGAIGKVPESIIDVGYGKGDFIKACLNIIPNCYGNDLGTNVIPEGATFIEDIYSRHFEVVTFFDVLEHFEDIYEIRNLKADYVLVSLPYCHYLSDEWFENWKHRKPNEHLWHFDRKSLANFMLEMGYYEISSANVEDIIRKGVEPRANILTSVFKKI